MTKAYGDDKPSELMAHCEGIFGKMADAVFPFREYINAHPELRAQKKKSHRGRNGYGVQPKVDDMIARERYYVVQRVAEEFVPTAAGVENIPKLQAVMVEGYRGIGLENPEMHMAALDTLIEKKFAAYKQNELTDEDHHRRFIDTFAGSTFPLEKEAEQFFYLPELTPDHPIFRAIELEKHYAMLVMAHDQEGANTNLEPVRKDLLKTYERLNLPDTHGGHTHPTPGEHFAALESFIKHKLQKAEKNTGRDVA